MIAVCSAPLEAGLGAQVLDLLPPDLAPLVWWRRGQGLIAWGEIARFEITGPNRAQRAADWWREIAAQTTVRDSVNTPGSGLIAFGSFVFDDRSSDTAVLVVPEVVVGQRGDQTWVTTMADDVTSLGAKLTENSLQERIKTSLEQLKHDSDKPNDSIGREIKWSNGVHRAQDWPGIVQQAIAAIKQGQVEKVVLARDEWAHSDQPFDSRQITRTLTAAYPSCWTYCIDGLIGATPEMLVRSIHGLVTSRVLAGTIRRSDGQIDDLRRAEALLESSKDLAEHEFAVASVARRLAELTEELNVPEVPFVLPLANVMHLASDITGVMRDGPSSLELAAALHPTAAVCGTPTAAARQLLAELEAMDRGRYAGPVGWIGANGDGEWGIALRGARLTPDQRAARLFAGGGIVAASVPAEELAETEAKFAPMRQALSAAGHQPTAA